MNDKSQAVDANPTPVSRGWMLDKRIPLAALVAFLVQFAGFIWYASQADFRLRATENELHTLKDQSTTTAAAVAKQSAATEMVQYRLDKMDQSQVRIESKLDALADRPR